MHRFITRHTHRFPHCRAGVVPRAAPLGQRIPNAPINDTPHASNHSLPRRSRSACGITRATHSNAPIDYMPNASIPNAQESFRALYRSGDLDDRRVTIEARPASAVLFAALSRLCSLPFAVACAALLRLRALPVAVACAAPLRLRALPCDDALWGVELAHEPVWEACLHAVLRSIIQSLQQRYEQQQQ